MYVVSLVSVLCCQVEVSASGWQLVQRSPTECGVSECDREASDMRRPKPEFCCCTTGKKITVEELCLVVNGVKECTEFNWFSITQWRTVERENFRFQKQ
jgi:hypothetical protein